MENQTVGPGRAQHIDDIVDEEASGLLSLVQGIFYWGVLALGAVVPIIGAFWGMIR